MVNKVEETLQERGKSYGDFLSNATVSQGIKDTFKKLSEEHGTVPLSGFDPDMLEALDMIALKISRILNGDPWTVDSWHDIAGYAELVADRLKQEGM